MHGEPGPDVAPAAPGHCLYRTQRPSGCGGSAVQSRGRLALGRAAGSARNQWIWWFRDNSRSRVRAWSVASGAAGTGADHPGDVSRAPRDPGTRNVQPVSGALSGGPGAGGVGLRAVPALEHPRALRAGEAGREPIGARERSGAWSVWFPTKGAPSGGPGGGDVEPAGGAPSGASWAGEARTRGPGHRVVQDRRQRASRGTPSVEAGGRFAAKSVPSGALGAGGEGRGRAGQRPSGVRPAWLCGGTQW